MPRPQRDDPYYCEVVQCRHCGGVGRVEEDGPPDEPYLPSREVEIDEDEFALFCEMTEEESEAEVARAEKEFFDGVDRMTPLAQYRYWRRYVLTSIMENRRRLRDPKLARIEVIDELWRNSIKRSQQSLLKHRHKLHTGQWPGSA